MDSSGSEIHLLLVGSLTSFVQIHDTLTYFYLRIGRGVAPELVRRQYAVRGTGC